jgi:hypothetical protein
MIKAIQFTIISFFLIILTASISCASKSNEKLEETLRQRVESYMKASIEGDWASAYPFFESSYRKAVSEDQFTSKPRKVRTKGYTLKRIEMAPDGETAKIELSLDISFQGYTFKDAPKTQTWIWEKGNWYIKITDNAASPPLPKRQ